MKIVLPVHTQVLNKHTPHLLMGTLKTLAARQFPWEKARTFAVALLSGKKRKLPHYEPVESKYRDIWKVA